MTANLAGVLEAAAARHGWGNSTAFVVGDRWATYDEIHDGAARSASLFSDLGAGPGTVVIIALGDGIEFVWAFLGAVRAGSVAVPVNPQLTAEDHQRLAEDCSARVVVCVEELADRFRALATVVTPELVGRAAASGDRLPPARSEASDPAYAQYTSGTTGAAKAAVHRHGDPQVYAQAFARAALGLSPDDVVLSVSKMYFAYGLGNSLFFPLLSGARAVLCSGRPSVEVVAGLMHRHAVTVLFAVPTFYANLVRTPPVTSPSSLRMAVSAGEHLTEALVQRLRPLLGCPVLNGLGSTEVGQTFASTTPTDLRDGTVGRALPPYEVEVRDRLGRPVPPGTVGRLFVRGPTVMLGYLGKPLETQAALEGEWLRTGDLASIDGEGFVHHHGRADDMEMVGGISVSPLEIEALLGGHPAVAEVAVAGVRDGDGASRLLAFVVPAGPVDHPEELEDQLLALAATRLAPFKVPRSVTFVDALPRTATGKLRRFALRAGQLTPPPVEARPL